MSMDPGSVFDDYAADYNGTIQRAIGASGESVEFFASLRARLLASLIGSANDSPSVLDFGCGIGNMTREVASRLPFAAVVGTDISERSLAIARSRETPCGQRIEYTATQLDRLPFPDGSFDFAFTSGVFHHIEPVERLHWLTELKRVLTPRGRFCLFEHNPLNPLTVRAVGRIPFDQGVKLLTASEATALLRRAGFKVSPTHYDFFSRDPSVSFAR